MNCFWNICDEKTMRPPSQAKPSQAKPSQAKPSQAKPSQHIATTDESQHFRRTILHFFHRIFLIKQFLAQPARKGTDCYLIILTHKFAFV